MKKTLKDKTSRPVKRTLFAELKEGVMALAEARQGKRTLRKHAKPTLPGKQSMSKA